MKNIKTKSAFTFAVMQGLGGNFDMNMRHQFYQFALNLAQERVADPQNLLMNCFDEKTQAWTTYVN
jgi:hypothetical protein